jgi:hypothetical protein
MSITIQGIEGEKIARNVLKNNFGINNLFQLDWLFKYNDKYYCVEVKHKELFIPPPFYGQGLDLRQVNSRIEFYKKTGIRCIFMVIDKDDGNIYLQWLDKLEKGIDKFTTRNNIRIYNIDRFKKIGVMK